ncbi:MAG TPA: PTS lactose/cellobiose transporter subunit IIA [Ruminococcaceae bacterium]|jgi:PTS system cellobiose-specific IIA component|nr:PTS lactose/cellobiose transporter subunit IIA [Oscillospiraceae bacterium]
MDMEKATMQLIVNSGDARSKAMEAIESAKAGNFDDADQKIQSADEALSNAHESQASIIQAEAAGEIKRMTLLMAHAQDHLMCAIAILDVAKEFIALYRKIQPSGSEKTGGNNSND